MDQARSLRAAQDAAARVSPRTADNSVNSANSQTSVSPPSTTLPVPRKRRRTTASASADCCRTCRLRKVKCTGKPDSGAGCANCLRLDLPCTFTTDQDSVQDQERVARTTPSKSHTEAGTLRKRAQRACSQCHAHKTKCSGDLPRCKRCETSGLACEYTPAKRKFANIPVNIGSDAGDDYSNPNSGSPPIVPTTHNIQANGRPPSQGLAPYDTTSNFSGELELLRKDVILKHMNAYYEHLYYLPCYGFFHPDRTYQDIQEDRFHPGQAAAVCAVASWLMNPGEAGLEFSRKCNEQLEHHIFRNSGNFSEISLQMLLLSSVYHWMNGQYGKMWMHISQAARLVYALQLNWDLEETSNPNWFIEQETRRRLVWHVYVVDRILAAGFDEHILLPDNNMFLRLPCDEDSFRNNQPVNMERLEQKPALHSRGNLSLLACHVRLSSLRHQVLRITKRYVPPKFRNYPHNGNLEPSHIMEDVNQLQQAITRLRESLPSSLQVSDQTILSYLHSPERSSFIMLHTWIGQLYIDLYRFTLPGIPDQASPEILRKLPPEFVAKSQKQAIAHAISLARFWEHLFAMRSPSSPADLVCTDFLISLSIVQVIHVLISARKHRLYKNLNEHSTAPLWRNEDVTDDTLDRLIESSMEFMKPLANLVPRVGSLEREMRQKIDDFYAWKENEKSVTSLTAIGTHQHDAARLPGPYYILEHAIINDKENEPRRHSSDVASIGKWFNGRLAPSASDTPVIFPPKKQDAFNFGPPDLPVALAVARGLFPAQPPPPAPQTTNVQTVPTDMMPLPPPHIIGQRVGGNSGISPDVEVSRPADTYHVGRYSAEVPFRGNAGTPSTFHPSPSGYG